MNQNVVVKPGIALDIDDCLADTKRYFISQLIEKFGNPENLTIDQIIEKYQIIPNISYWQTPEIKAWLDEQGSDNDVQQKIFVMDGAVEAVKRINEIVPVRMYITSRPSTVVDGTTIWLRDHGFPEAEVVTRPLSKIKIDGNAWKAEILKERFPEVSFLIDDNPEILSALGSDYQGTVCLFNGNYNQESLKEGLDKGPKTSLFKNWEELATHFQKTT